MASYSSQRAHNQTFSPFTPHFYKMILQDALFDNKLQIPRKFIEKYGTNINTSNPVLLKVPSGEEWKVKLTKYNGHVWLGEGWPEFARHYSILCGHSLFFRYEEQSKFHVVIVDENGSEIKYPVMDSTHVFESNTNIDELSKRKEEAQEDEDLNSDKKFSPNLRREENSLPPLSRSNRRMRTQRKPRGESQILRSVKRSLTDEKVKANPCFKVIMQKTHVQDPYELVLPLKFWRQHLNEKSGLVATLYVPQERTWLVKLQTRTIDGYKSAEASFLRNDWQTFSVANNLEIGNVCIFELINKNEMLFKVSINRDADDDQNGQVLSQSNFSNFAGNGEANPVELCSDETSNVAPGDQVLECDQGESNYVKPDNTKFGSKSKHGHTSHHEVTGVPSSSRVTSQFSTENPYFKVQLRGSCLSNLHVPVSFTRSYFGKKMQNALNVELEVDDKVWLGTMVTCPNSGQTFFSAGWRAFARENHLQAGDFCYFELVNKESDPVLFKVTISRRTTT